MNHAKDWLLFSENKVGGGGSTEDVPLPFLCYSRL